MKKYCSNCGYGNEYSIVPPKKCEKCDQNLVNEFLVPRIQVTPTKQTILTGELNQEEEDLSDGEFGNFMEGEPEPISQEEIQKIFLSKANKGVNLKDLISQEEKTSQRARKTTKATKRKK
jgi:hypothetical protein